MIDGAQATHTFMGRTGAFGRCWTRWPHTPHSGPQVVGQGGRVRPRHAHHHVGLLAFLSGYEFDLHRVGTIGSYHLETGVAGNRVFADWPQHAAADRAE